MTQNRRGFIRGIGILAAGLVGGILGAQPILSWIRRIDKKLPQEKTNPKTEPHPLLPLYQSPYWYEYLYSSTSNSDTWLYITATNDTTGDTVYFDAYP